MFGDINPYNEQIIKLLDIYSIDEVLELLDITPYEMLNILLSGGHACVPEYLEDNLIEDSVSE